MKTDLTPFGITTQPQFSYEPGSIEWTLLACIAFCICAIAWLTKFLKNRKSTRIHKALSRELALLKDVWKSDPKLASARLSSIAKRILNLNDSAVDYLALSAKETRSIIESKQLLEEETNDLSLNLCDLLDSLEKFRFSQHSNSSVTPIHEKIESILAKMSNK
jgi:hypothetical protein